MTSNLDLTSDESDPALFEVALAIKLLDPDGDKLAEVFRATFDQLYDGQNTGRYKIDQLMKTEKAHFGSLIEINMQRKLKFEDGKTLDYSIAGQEVDCKYSHTGAWMLPIESFDQIVLVAQADDYASKWNLGLVRVTEANRRSSENRDRKTGLNRHGREQILWLYRDWEMQPNALLLLSPNDQAEIMDENKSGQARLNTLFKIAQNQRLSRNIISTVARQKDSLKRVRANGGSRSALKPLGYLILGGDYKNQQNLASKLGATVPEEGEFVSIRVVPTTPDKGVEIDGQHWRVAEQDEPTTHPAPDFR